jgi:hypothetical protein
MFTCNDMNRKFKQGKCGGTPNKDERIIFSLYFAYSVDVATDLASTLIPTLILRYRLTQYSHVFIITSCLASPIAPQAEMGYHCPFL